MSNSSDFTRLLLAEVISHTANNYQDNVDGYRFQNRKPVRQALDLSLRGLLGKRGYVKLNMIQPHVERTIQLLDDFGDRLAQVYDLLADPESRNLFLKILAFRIMGNTKVKLPLNTPEFWQGIARLEQLASKTELVQIDFQNWKLNRLDLHELGYPLTVHSTPKAAYIQFQARQYECRFEGGVIKVQPGDVVIDGGGCWGDTALLFAWNAGDKGQVHSFEFIPSNLAIFQKNLELNPALKDRIHIAKHPLWEATDVDVYYKERGPGSRVTMENPGPDFECVKTLQIDEYVTRTKISKVDFIKMDIEGAELPALRGAVHTIQTFKPRLAIATYHSLDDFVNIPLWIHSLGLGYRLYLRHFSIHAEESILFASV